MEFQGFRSRLCVLLSIATATLVCLPIYAQQKNAEKSAEQAQALKQFRSISRPLTFEPNQGQAANGNGNGKDVRFLSRGQGYQLSLEPNEVVVSLAKRHREGGKQVLDRAHSVGMKLAGANQKAAIAGEGEVAGKSNYYIGNDRAKWLTGIANYSRVRYTGIYPGIDLLFYGNEKVLEHDFVVAPHANPDRIRLDLSGADSVSVEANGDLVMRVSGGELRLLKPVAYQQIHGKRQEVNGQYELSGNRVSFKLGRYDKRRELVIDPMLNYSSYFGGSGFDRFNGIAAQGTNVYIVGETSSPDMPYASNSCPSCGNYSAYAAAFTSTGTLIYSTYIGGNGENNAEAVAADGSGNAYIGGYTAATNFPHAGSGLSQVFQGGSYDGFITKLTSQGNLASSGYFGGGGEDKIQGIALTPSGVVATGYEQSANFPIANSQEGGLGGQFYKSIDGTANWNFTFGSSPLPGMDVQAFLIVPGTVAPTRYYVGGSMGVYTSTDAASWSAVGDLSGYAVTCLVQDPTLSGGLYACTSSGIFRYVPQSAAWLYEVSGSTNTILVDQTTPSTVYAGTDSGVEVSYDSGNSWQPANTGLPSSPFINTLAQDSSGNLYAGTSSNSGVALYKSVGAASWSAPSANGFPQDYEIHSLTFDNASGRMFAGTSETGAFVTTDGGNNWTALGSLSGQSGTVNSLLVDPITSTTLYEATEDGVWVSTDNGATFNRSSSGIQATSVRGFAIDVAASLANGATVLYAGSMASQGFATTFDSSLNTVSSTPFGGGSYFDYFGTQGTGVAADASGNFYVTATTTSQVLPNAQNGNQTTLPSDANHSGALLAFTSAGVSRWSTYIGGSSQDEARSVAISPTDSSVVVGGESYSSDFPVLNSFEACAPGSGYFSKYASGGTKTFAECIGTDAGINGVAVNSTTGAIWLAGTIDGGSAPESNPLPYLPPNSTRQGYVAQFASAGGAPLFSTTFGGTDSETESLGVALDANGSAYITGYTNASDFPLAGNYLQSYLAGGYGDGYLVQLTDTGLSNDISIAVTPTTVTAYTNNPTPYNITVTNNTTTGNGASNVSVTTDLQLYDFESPNGSCSSGQGATCNFGNLPPGTSVTATATMVYPSNGTFTNNFYARTDDNDPVPSNNTAPVTAAVTTVSGPDVGVTLTSPANAAHDGQFDYTVTITNYGPILAGNFSVMVALDNSLSFQYSDGQCYQDGGVYCFFDDGLSAGASQVIHITVQTPSTQGQVTSTATLNGVSGDPNPNNDSSTVITNIVASADLYGYFEGDESSAIIGAPYPLTVNVHNYGPDPATNVAVTLNIPAQFLVSPMPSNCTGTGTLTCTVGNVGSDADATVQLSVVPNSSGVYTLLGSVQDTGTSADPYTSNNQFQSSVTAGPSRNANFEQFIISLTDSGSLYVDGGFDFGEEANTYKATSAPGINAVDATGRYVYVASNGSNYTSVVDLTVNQEVARLHGVNGDPMAVSPDGSRLVTRSISMTGDALAVIDTTTFQVVKTISLDGMFGDQAGVSDLNFYSGVIANNKLYLQLAYTPATGTPLYTTAVIDLGTNSVKQVTGAGGSVEEVPQEQHTIVASSDGTRVFALRRFPGQLLVIDTSSDAVLTTVSLPLYDTTALAATRDPNDPVGQFVYIAGSGEGDNEIVDYGIAQGTVLDDGAEVSFPVSNMVLSGNGEELFAVYNGYTANSNAAVFFTQPLNPYDDGDNEYQIPGVIGGLSIGYVTQDAYQFAPQITGTLPASIDNSIANKLSILGSNFSPNSRVKVGHLDASSATFVSTGRLDVNLPALVPEQDATIVVTVPNPQELPTARNVSGISSLQLSIRNSGFNLPTSLLLMRFGESKLNLIDTSKNGINIGTLPNPTSLALSPDNQTAYVATGLYPVGVDAISLANGSVLSTIGTYGQMGSEDALATATDPVDGKPVLYFNSGDSDLTDDVLNVVDADSTSPTFNQVKRTIETYDDTYNQGSGALVASPSGRYVYTFADAYDLDLGTFLGTNILAYDALTGATTQINDVKTAFNGEQMRPRHMRISPDGNWLLVPGNDGSIKALNISADPMLGNYTVTTIGDAGHSYKTFQVSGSRLFAFDANTNTVTAFNFLPANADFSKLGSVTLSGATSRGEAPLLVDPTGAYVYVGLKDQDAIAFLDADKVANSDPSAVLDEGGNDYGIEAIAIPGAIIPQVDLAASIYSDISFPENSPAYLSATVLNKSVNDAHNVSAIVTFPAGLNVTSASWSTSDNSGECAIGSTVVCNIPVLAGGSPSGDTANLYIGFTAPPVAQSPVSFSLSVSSTETDSVPSDNMTTASININPASDLAISAQFPSSPVQAGQHLSYTVTASNLGPANLNAGIYIDIYAGLNNVVITPPAGAGCDINYCSTDSLAANTSLVFTVTGDVPPTGSTVALSADISSSSNSDPNYNNNNVSTSLQVGSSGNYSPQFLVTDTGIGQAIAFSPSNLDQVVSGTVGVVPLSILPMPNGRTAFIVNFDSNYISVVDMTVQAEIYRIQNEPGRVATLNSDASQLIVSNRFDPTVLDVFDTSTFALVKHISIANIVGNSFVTNMFVAGTDLYLMLANQSGSPIYIVDLTNDNLITIPGTSTFGNPRSSRFGITPDGSTVVAVGGGTAAAPAKAYIVNPFTRTATSALTLSDNTSNLSLAITPNSGGSIFAYITTDYNLQMLDVSPADDNSGQFLPGVNIALPISPTSSAITADGATLGFAQAGENLESNVASIPVNSLPYDASISSSEMGRNLSLLSTTVTDFLPLQGAPVISSISPYGVLNNTSAVLEIDGSNFSSDAMVKIGAANPVTPSSITSTHLTVTMPAFTPSGNPPIVVIDQNAAGPLSGRNVAGPPYTYYVGDSPAFSPQYDTFTANYGDGAILENGSKGVQTNSTREVNPWTIAVTTGDYWYASSFTDQSVETNFSTEDNITISLSGSTAYGDALDIVSDANTGRAVALTPSQYSLDQGITYDWQLNVIDVDPYSPTVNIVLRTIQANVANVVAGAPGAAAFVATPNGKFGYQQVELNDGSSDLVIYDLTSGEVTALNCASLGIDPFVQGMQVSPDSKYLVVANLESNNIKVFSIATPTSPSLVATIPIQYPNNGTFTDCCNMRIVNNMLYAFDPGTMLLQTFDFQPASSDFAPQGVLQLPGHPDATYQGGLAVSPDGAYVYVAEMDDDAVEVLDGTRIATGDITQALIDRFSSQGHGPVSIGLNPLPSYTNSSDLSVTVSHTPDPVPLDGNVTYQITANDLGPSPSGYVLISDSLPPGVTFVSATITGANTGTCSGTTVVTCDFDSMSPATTTIITLVADTSGASAGPITNTVSISQTSEAVPDPVPGNNIAVDTATVAGPDLAVTVTADNSSPSINGTVNFTISVTNNGGGPATNVSVASTLDAGSLALPNMQGCSLSGNVYTCTFASIAAGATVTYTEAATMPSTAGQVNLTTVATEDQTESHSSDNTVVTAILVGGGADVAVSAQGAPVSIGGIPSYTVIVTNNGPNSAANVVVTDTLTRYGFVSATSTAGACSYDGVLVTCQLGAMANGASVTINVSVTPPDSGWASNEFHATSSTFDPVPTNNLANIGPFGGTVGNTRAGADVLVDALDANSGTAVNFLFSNVTKPGLTAVTSAAGTQAPAGYRFGKPALVYDLSTTASFVGSIRVALQFGAVAFRHPNELRLFHMENGAWVDRTSALDVAHGTISAVTASLSPFVIAEPLDSAPVANAGGDQTLPGAGATGAPVTLSGAASSDADSDALTYTWTGPFPEGNGTITGVNPKVTLPLGTSKVTLVVNDGEMDSNPAAVNVTVSDFLLAAPAAPITLLRGGSASFNVVLTPEYGSFDEAVALACGGQPAGITCTLSNASVTPGTQGSSATVTLTASASAMRTRPSGPIFAFWISGLPLAGVLLLGAGKRKNRLACILLLLLLLALAAGMVACGGGGGGGAVHPPTQSSTSTTVTITGTAGGLQHTSSVNVIVQ